MKFYTGPMFPEQYRGNLFIAEHGSWNRTPEAGHTGYNVTMVNTKTGAKTILIDGWLMDNVAWGRPVDIMEMPDGSLLISDDHANVIYRLTYEAPQARGTAKPQSILLPQKAFIMRSEKPVFQLPGQDPAQPTPRPDFTKPNIHPHLYC
jgi:hypothetical protein